MKKKWGCNLEAAQRISTPAYCLNHLILLYAEVYSIQFYTHSNHSTHRHTIQCNTIYKIPAFIHHSLQILMALVCRPSLSRSYSCRTRNLIGETGYIVNSTISDHFSIESFCLEGKRETNQRSMRDRSVQSYRANGDIALRRRENRFDSLRPSF